MFSGVYLYHEPVDKKSGTPPEMILKTAQLRSHLRIALKWLLALNSTRFFIQEMHSLKLA